MEAKEFIVEGESLTTAKKSDKSWAFLKNARLKEKMTDAEIVAYLGFCLSDIRDLFETLALMFDAENKKDKQSWLNVFKGKLENRIKEVDIELSDKLVWEWDKK